ncbi:hypothetical protein SAMN05444392_1097 [Seinonella peptonophila]|uniref:Uncharacterized protein n=1 Tax=Seinonella peptonophila TaxID=112248 RepID=A0A1M4ZEB6_9BACL|nr:hypothetical protein [Seinonella peptonophila]SHF16360.1 hypothetical protein SAMN05444392_1097 [Seinonella peptonophila]
MKKIISYIKNGSNQAFSEQHRILPPTKLSKHIHPFHIFDKSYSSYGKVNQETDHTYLQSFMKQRMLTIWKGQRQLLNVAPMFPEPLESIIYKNVYERIKPLLMGAYHEDFHQSEDEFSFESWLQSLQQTAYHLSRPTDAICWDEIALFMKKYAEKPRTAHD